MSRSTAGTPRTTDRGARRRFLTGLGAIAAAGTLAPLGLARVARARATRLESGRPALGTWVRIAVVHADAERAAQAMTRAFAAIAQVDALMSIHRPDSDVSRINAASGREAVAVHADVREVVKRARAAAVATHGVYDPTVLPLMRLWGFYGATRAHRPSDAEHSAALAAVGHEQIVVDDAAGTVGLAHRGAALDLGSIGKGWALDRALAALRAEGVSRALVDVGRNVGALGTPDDDSAGWRVGVLHPETNEVMRVLELRDAAVATSSNAEQWHWLDGERVGHLLDARHGVPAHTRRSATVRAANGTASDVGSTVAFLLGRDAALALPGVHDAELLA